MSSETVKQWIPLLESLRFDVVQHDPLQAHKQYDTQHVVDVTIDDSGQIRMIITRQIAETQREERQSRTGRVYLVFVERNAIATVNYRLNPEDDLRAVLDEMEKVGGRQ